MAGTLSEVATSELLNSIANELVESDDPDVTKETLVLRRLQKITQDVFNVSWTRILDTVRHGQCYLNSEDRRILKRVLSLHPNEEFFEKVASKDYVKTSDVVRLALSNNESFENNRDVCHFFAVDGFSGFHDLRLYVPHLKCTEDYKIRHVRAVKKLYKENGMDARQIRRVVDIALGAEEEEETNDAAVLTYKSYLEPSSLRAVREWKTKELAAKKKNSQKKTNDLTKKTKKRNVSSSEDEKPVFKKFASDYKD